jgi:DNA-binding GntR family transcriptional regulator
VLLRLVTGLLDQGERPWAQQFAIHFDNAKTCTAVLAEHRDIVAALAARNPEQACKAMRAGAQRSEALGIQHAWGEPAQGPRVV